MSAADWERLVAGIDCPPDAPREAANEHWDSISVLSVSSLYLATDERSRLIESLRAAIAEEER